MGKKIVIDNIIDVKHFKQIIYGYFKLFIFNSCFHSCINVLDLSRIRNILWTVVAIECHLSYMPSSSGYVKDHLNLELLCILGQVRKILMLRVDGHSNI